MGNNYRFTLSEMMPMAWFYKLKETTRTSRAKNSNSNASPSSSNKKKSSRPTPIPTPNSNYQYSPPNGFHNSTASHRIRTPTPADPPRRSSYSKTLRRTSRRPPVSDPACSISTTNADLTPDQDHPQCSELRESQFHHGQASTFSFTTSSKPDHALMISESIDLTPISAKIRENHKLTEPIITSSSIPKAPRKKSCPANAGASVTAEDDERGFKKKVDGERNKIMAASGVKLRPNSPRFANRKINQALGGRRKSTSTALVMTPTSSRLAMQRKHRGADDEMRFMAITKASEDPQRDFMESMAAMIGEYNIRAANDLEELLAWYLSLNSDEFHDLIVKAFQGIWFALSEIHDSRQQ
ncbi:transcription repressor OFP1-like [Malania oleifera]|uniref:transcription repressor OFP1-like n=1 Tax=Malania oleifera TaxID=397392 RepID=UPI0025ADB6F3|nr:transcription repressor OFP1-like [Malania oleifera]